MALASRANAAQSVVSDTEEAQNKCQQLLAGDEEEIANCVGQNLPSSTSPFSSSHVQMGQLTEEQECEAATAAVDFDKAKPNTP